jgi:hypothetical protein
VCRPDNTAIKRERSFFNALSQEERGNKLLQAAQNGQYRRLRLLIEAEANLDYEAENGWTAPHLSVFILAHISPQITIENPCTISNDTPNVAVTEGTCLLHRST